MDPFIGQICVFAGETAPRGWALCHGQSLPVLEYGQLFKVIGTTYGGDGINEFALPDLRGRAPAGIGEGPGLPEKSLGDTGTYTRLAAPTPWGGNVEGIPYVGVHYFIATG